MQLEYSGVFSSKPTSSSRNPFSPFSYFPPLKWPSFPSPYLAPAIPAVWLSEALSTLASPQSHTSVSPARALCQICFGGVWFHPIIYFSHCGHFLTFLLYRLYAFDLYAYLKSCWFSSVFICLFFFFGFSRQCFSV